MKRLFSLAVTFVALTAATQAHASLLDTRFSGTVDSQINSAFTVGSAVAGTFVYDTVLARFVSFNIGGLSVLPGYASTASITPDLYSAIYQAQVSPVGQGGNLNSTFSVDLEGLNPWPSNNAIALLLNASQLATNLDTTLSTFGFFTGNADGTNIRSLSATLSAIQVTVIPEPGTMSLLFAGAAAVGMTLSRRRRR